MAAGHFAPCIALAVLMVQVNNSAVQAADLDLQNRCCLLRKAGPVDALVDLHTCKQGGRMSVAADATLKLLGEFRSRGGL